MTDQIGYKEFMINSEIISNYYDEIKEKLQIIDNFIKKLIDIADKYDSNIEDNDLDIKFSSMFDECINIQLQFKYDLLVDFSYFGYKRALEIKKISAELKKPFDIEYKKMKEKSKERDKS